MPDAINVQSPLSETDNPLTRPACTSASDFNTDAQSNSSRLESLHSLDVDKAQIKGRQRPSAVFPNGGVDMTSPVVQDRPPLFEELPDASIPGNVHLVSDTSLERLIESNGAIFLLRQMAKDLAERDSQVTELRKRYEDREKRLKGMLYESGVSRSDVEKRLASISSHRRSSRESVLSGKPRSEFSYIETLDDQLQEAMSGVDEEEEEASHDDRDDSVQVETPKPRGQKNPSKGNYISDMPRSPQLTSSNGSPGIPKNHRRTLTFSKWSAGLFGWDSKKDNQGLLKQSPDTQDLMSSTAGSATTHQLRADSGSDAALMETRLSRSTSGSGLKHQDAPDQKLTKERQKDQRTDLWPKDLGQPPHSKAIVLAGRTKPPDLDAPTSEGWLVSKRTSSIIANLAYNLVFDRLPIEPSESSDLSPELKIMDDTRLNNGPASHRGSRNIDDMHSRLKSISHGRGNESWITPVLRDTAHSVLPNSTQTRKGARHSTMELETFIPDADQPPTMLPAWNDHSHEQGLFLTDRFGFKLFDARSKRREAAERIYETIVLDGNTQDKVIRSDRKLNSKPFVNDNSPSRSPRAVTQAAFTASPCSDSAKSANEDAAENDALSMTASTSTRNLQAINDFAVSPRPLNPETSLNKSGAIFSNEKSSARLLMLSQLDLYGADKARQENWDTFLKKTREDRRKTGAHDEDWVDQNEDELIGLAGLGIGKMARDRRKELDTLVMGGIPMSYRPKIWGELTGAYMLKEPLYYQNLLNHGKDVDKICVDQIELDIKRTMPSNVFFAGTGPGVSKLRRVLLAFSRHNPEVGYCQGMNVIAATLLLTHATEEDAFFVLACIVEKFLPMRYFTPDLLTSRADQRVLKYFVKELCPRVHKQLEKLGIDLEAITFGWFLSVFTDCLPAEHLFRIWDIFFSEGHPFMFCVAIALIKTHEAALVKCDSPAEVYTLLKELKKAREMNIDEFVRLTEQIKVSIKNKGYDVP